MLFPKHSPFHMLKIFVVLGELCLQKPSTQCESTILIYNCCSGVCWFNGILLLLLVRSGLCAHLCCPFSELAMLPWVLIKAVSFGVLCWDLCWSACWDDGWERENKSRIKEQKKRGRERERRIAWEHRGGRLQCHCGSSEESYLLFDSFNIGGNSKLNRKRGRLISCITSPLSLFSF